MTDDRRNQLEMRWLPVTGADGRTHMESVWITPAEPAAITHAA